MPSIDAFGESGVTDSTFSAIHGISSGDSERTVIYKRELDEDRQERRRKRKSRWNSDDNEKTFIPGMPTNLPTNLSNEQQEAYVLQLQIEEISRKLRTGDLGIPENPEERSPSPEPIYGFDGKRMNTREYRTRKRLEEERHHLIGRMIKVNPDFKPPADYKPPLTRVSDKVMIPQDIHPDINFVGLLIGPRGNTLKAMEHETGAKIIIRGKGSVKEGKVGRKDGQPLPGENEPLHAYVTANNPECVKKAVDKIKEIIRQGVEVPEGQNDLRRQQLRELALLNGTLRENDGIRCTNCGAADHKSWTCPDKPNVTMQVICTVCGGAGHIAKDCRQKPPGMPVPQSNMSNQDKAKIDQEYMSLMAELGEGPLPGKDDGNHPNLERNRSSGNLFDRPSAPRAIGAPPVSAPPPPPHLIPNSLPPPPWSPHTSKMPTPNMNVPPPIGTNSGTGGVIPPTVPSSWQPPMMPTPYYYPNMPPATTGSWGPPGAHTDPRNTISPPRSSTPSWMGGPPQKPSWQPPGIPPNLHNLLIAPPPPPPPPPKGD